MVNKVINEIKTALDNDLYILALMGTLTLIDTCGKAEYPNKGVGDRYRDWYNNFIHKYEVSSGYAKVLKCKFPEITGEVVYSLRCALLHEDNPNIQIDKIKNKDNKITKFVLEIEKKNKFDIYVNSFGIKYSMDEKDIKIDREYNLSVRGFCLKVCQESEKYYNANKSKFNFNYNILDIDKVKAEIRQNENR